MAANNELDRQLSEAYDMERKLVVALDEMARGAGDEQLVNLLTEHRRVTEAQAGRIGEVFGMLRSPVARNACQGVDDLVGEYRTRMAEPGLKGLERDLAVIDAAARIERFELDAYRLLLSTVRSADLEEEALGRLQQNHAEESATAEQLESLGRQLRERAAAESSLFGS
ncbi:MAG: ferritin-like domain-containing protein [Actinomycetota bacterium]